MPINKSIADLPRSDRPEGNPPSKNNFVAERIANHWGELDDHEAPALAVPEAGAWRGSFASSRCNRSLYYKMAGIEQSDPPTVADRWRMGLGTTIHTMLQQIAGDLFNSPDFEEYSNAESEVKVDLRPVGINGSANLDFVFDYKGKKCAVEIKSKGGFAFKAAATTFRGPAEGPKFGELLQGALSAKALGCELLVVCYLAMENVGASMAKTYAQSEAGRFAAEWHYTVLELEEFIEYEVARIKMIEAAVAAEEIPKRTLMDPTIPEGAEINAPSNGGWVVLDDDGGITDSGSTWYCDYCPHRTRCQEDGR